jgi:hypothetical protein
MLITINETFYCHQVYEAKICVFPRIVSYQILCISLLENPSLTQEQNMYATENSVIHIERLEKSVIHIQYRLSRGIYVDD